MYFLCHWYIYNECRTEYTYNSPRNSELTLYVNTQRQTPVCRNHWQRHDFTKSDDATMGGISNGARKRGPKSLLIGRQILGYLEEMAWMFWWVYKCELLDVLLKQYSRQLAVPLSYLIVGDVKVKSNLWRIQLVYLAARVPHEEPSKNHRIITTITIIVIQLKNVV